jgi:hypothetical protein
MGRARIPLEVGLVAGGCLALGREHFLRQGGFARFTGSAWRTSS